jgi:cellulose synthase (UDP-forming)
VTFPAFLAHSVPTVIAITLFAALMQHDGLFRPRYASVISWEKALFLLVQWPWVAFGCLMAVRDWLSGRFVDFRITPKGDTTAARLPLRIIVVYTLLMLGCILPVLLCDAREAPGFYLLSALNAFFYAVIVVVAVALHLRESGRAGQIWRGMGLQFSAAGMISGLLVAAVILRAPASLHALTYGAPGLSLTRAEYVVSGAGNGANIGAMQIRFKVPSW